MEVSIAIFVGRGGSLEVARIGKPIGADGAEFREAERQAVVFADVSAHVLFRENDTEFYAARDDANLSGRHFEEAEFRVKAERSQLGNDEKFSIGGVEE